MFKTVLIPVDTSVPGETQRLLDAAAELTKPWGSDLHVATVIPTVGTALVGSYMDPAFEAKRQEAMAADLAAATQVAKVDATPHVLTGTVYDCVIDLANRIKADLIVIGAHHPELADYLLGTNAARVVRHSTQSVLVLRDPK